ncbi:hypothetical protein QGN29_10000 [Temperatibacter marinus]|uniref:TolA protein n=1 Tax=Temperatibacter marinus TaxID=1456591 RepID=A0AA52H9R7_9PROT|nr:hypothetical protein [Temperatibacter marinus]WND01883.1 hypothetical protein QGN29_10000 [Temperatibacter marinus]
MTKETLNMQTILTAIKNMDRGLAFSLALHGGIVTVALVGLPELTSKRPPVPEPIQIDFVKVEKERKIVKKAEETREEPQEEKRKPSYAKNEAVAALTPDAMPTLKPAKPAKKLKPKPKPKVTKQMRLRNSIRPKMKPKPPKRFKSSKIAELIDRSLKEETKETPKPKKKAKKPKAKIKEPKKKAPSFEGLAGRIRAAAIRDAIAYKLNNCWNRPKGLKNSEDMAAPIRLYLNLQGELARKPIMLDGDYDDAAQPFKRVFGDSVIRAAMSCGKFEEAIPIIKAGNKYFDITFRPPDIYE